MLRWGYTAHAASRSESNRERAGTSRHPVAAEKESIYDGREGTAFVRNLSLSQLGSFNPLPGPDERFCSPGLPVTRRLAK